MYRHFVLPCTQTCLISIHIVISGLWEVGIQEKSNQWSKLVGTGMPFIIGDSNCRSSVRTSLYFIVTNRDKWIRHKLYYCIININTSFITFTGGCGGYYTSMNVSFT
jgi:hypothetical protein